jgi:hypothetical protein
MFQFAMPTFRVGLWSYDQGQQPFWGVGRLRLSFLGFAEPRLDKCNDLRLFFVFSQEFGGLRIAVQRKTPEK